MTKNHRRPPRNSTRPGRRGESAPTRLQKVLAEAGFGSRRQCEELISDGRVEVDGHVADQLGVKVDPHKQKIYVDGQRVRVEKKQYFAIYKPPGVVSTSRDPAGRLRVVDLIKTDKRIYNVGRLDKSSEGLMVVTNDGDLANRLTHPRYRVSKTYLVQVRDVPHVRDLRSLERGVHLAEGFAKAQRVKLKKKTKLGAELEIVLTEGRNREIRRLLARIGHKVLRLKRVAIGSLRLGNLPVGAYRELTKSEVDSLMKSGFPSQPRVAKKPTPRRHSAKKRSPAQRAGKPFAKTGGHRKSPPKQSGRPRR